MFRGALICFFLFLIVLTADTQPSEFQLISKTREVSPEIFHNRSTVIFSSPRKDEVWKEKAERIHRQLIRMGVDPVIYLHYDDFTSGITVTRKFHDLMATRNISNIFLIHDGERIKQMAVIPFENGRMNFSGKSWYDEAASLNDVIFKFALEVKKLDISNTNFLVADYPEIVEDVILFNGKQYPNYPSRLTRATLAVTLYPTISDPDSINLPGIRNHNEKVEALNNTIKATFRDYPFPYQFVQDDTDENLYKNRFQYVLRVLNTSGKTIRNMLNYEVDENETDYISVVPLPNGSRTLKTYGIDEKVYKCYIQQTARSDVHVGRYWDADKSLSQAITNFLLHLQNNVQ